MQSMIQKYHIVYLAIITILIIGIVFILAKLVKANNTIISLNESFKLNIPSKSKKQIRAYNKSNIIKQKDLNEYKQEIDKFINQPKYPLKAIILLEIARMNYINNMRKNNIMIKEASIIDLASLAMCSEDPQIKYICDQTDWVRDNCPDIKNFDRIAILLIENIIEQSDIKLFEFAIIAGWLSSGGSVDELDTMKMIGNHIGNAYKIANDLSSNDENNFVDEYGLDVSIKELKRNLKGVEFLLKQNDLYSTIWEKEIIPSIKSQDKFF